MNLVDEAQETSDEMIWGACSLVSARYATLGTVELRGYFSQNPSPWLSTATARIKIPTPTPLSQPRNWNWSWNFYFASAVVRFRYSV
jgi:hypothetical protein